MATAAAAAAASVGPTGAALNKRPAGNGSCFGGARVWAVASTGGQGVLGEQLLNFLP